MDLQEELKKHIKAISYPLKSGLDLELALKAKLTKKELKLLKLWAQNAPKEQILNSLNLEKEALLNLSQKLIKKLNQEKTKQALYDFTQPLKQ